MFGLIPREEAFFDLFRRAGHNVIEGSRLLKEMMENFHDPAGQAKRIKEVEHIGDEITHEIAKKLNQTFITPIDREDIHDLASALDDILDVAEEIADCFVIIKCPNRRLWPCGLPISSIRRVSPWPRPWTSWADATEK